MPPFNYFWNASSIYFKKPSYRYSWNVPLPMFLECVLSFILEMSSFPLLLEFLFLLVFLEHTQFLRTSTFILFLEPLSPLFFSKFPFPLKHQPSCLPFHEIPSRSHGRPQFPAALSWRVMFSQYCNSVLP